MSFLKKLAGQTAIYGLSSVVPRLLNYILIVVHSRVFLPEQYGVVTEFYAYLGFLLVLLTFGFETGYFRFASQNHNNNAVFSTAFITLLIINTLFLILAITFSSKIVSALGYRGQPELVILTAAIISLDCVAAIPFARLRQLNRPLIFSAVKIISVVINVFFNVFFLILAPKISFLNNSIYNHHHIIHYVFISNLIASLFSTITVLYLSRKEKRTYSLKTLKTLLLYSIPLLISGIGGTTNETFDRIFIKHLVPEENNPLYQLGIYGSNVKLAVLMVLFIQMYRYAAEPFFFKSASEETPRTVYSITTKYFLAFTLLVFLFVSLFIDFFQYLVGKEFRTGLDVVPILLLANVFYGLYFNLSIWYKLVNKTLYGILFTFIGALITILINILFTRHIGFYGAAWARLACYVVMCVLCFWLGQRFFKIPYDIKGIVTILLVSLFIFYIGYYINIDNQVFSVLFRIALLLAYIIFFYFYEYRFGDKQLNFKTNAN